MQGLRAHSDSFLAAMCLECYVLLHYFERARATKGGFWSQVSMERANGSSTVPRFCLGKAKAFLCLSIMGTWKSLCKAFEHIATAFWPLCDWSVTFCYTTLSEQGAQRVDVGTR